MYILVIKHVTFCVGYCCFCHILVRERNIVTHFSLQSHNLRVTLFVLSKLNRRILIYLTNERIFTHTDGARVEHPGLFILRDIL